MATSGAGTVPGRTRIHRGGAQPDLADGDLTWRDRDRVHLMPGSRRLGFPETARGHTTVGDGIAVGLASHVTCVPDGNIAGLASLTADITVTFGRGAHRHAARATARLGPGSAPHPLEIAPHASDLLSDAITVTAGLGKASRSCDGWHRGEGSHRSHRFKRAYASARARFRRWRVCRIAALTKTTSIFAGIERAESVALVHKWLYTPLRRCCGRARLRQLRRFAKSS